jgi:hypothetical protein
MLLEELDELADFRFLGWKIARVLGHFNEAIAIARFLHFWEKEIQDDKVEVLNFVRPAFDELARGHERRHVTAYAHPAGMRMIGHDRNELGFD